jgi:hypothetical protein
MKVLLQILVFVLLTSTGLSADIFPIATTKTENDVVPQLWKGWLLLDYNVLFYDYGPVKPVSHFSYGSSEMMTDQEFDLYGVLGLGRSLSAHVIFPYHRMENTGQYSLLYGQGDIDIAGKWNFVNADESSRAGVMVGCTVPTGYDRLSSRRVLPWMKFVSGFPIGSNRFIGNIGYRYYPMNSVECNIGSQIPFSVAFQLNGHDDVIFPVELFGHYQFHSLYHPAQTSIRLNLTLNWFAIKDHLSIGGGMLLPFQAYLGSAGGIHLNVGFYY